MRRRSRRCKVKTKKTILLVLTCISLIVLSSCTTSKDKDETVKKVIVRYTDALVEANRYGKFKRLRDVASEEIVARVTNSYLSYVNAEKIALDARFQGIIFDSINHGSGEDDVRVEVTWHSDEKEWREGYVFKETFVETSEKWLFKWIDIETGELASPEINASYKMRYTLDWKDGKMLVMKTEITEEEILSSVGESDRWKKSHSADTGHGH